MNRWLNKIFFNSKLSWNININCFIYSLVINSWFINYSLSINRSWNCLLSNNRSLNNSLSNDRLLNNSSSDNRLINNRSLNNRSGFNISSLSDNRLREKYFITNHSLLRLTLTDKLLIYYFSKFHILMMSAVVSLILHMHMLVILIIMHMHLHILSILVITFKRW